jgi:hypothetical protein
MVRTTDTRIEPPAQELFRPETDQTPAYACGLLLYVILFAREFAGPLVLAAFIAVSVMAVRDFLTAAWLWRRDPDRGRARAALCFCLSRAMLKLTAAGISLASLVDAPYGWHRRIDWRLPTALMAGLGAHAALAVAGYFLASRSGVRIWIDSGLHRSRKQDVWPPRCFGTTNQPTRVWPTAVACALIIVAFGVDTLADACVNTQLELPVGCAVIGFAAGTIAWTARAGAATPEECWYRRAK